jgi:hypothetical protein
MPWKGPGATTVLTDQGDACGGVLGLQATRPKKSNARTALRDNMI